VFSESISKTPSDTKKSGWDYSVKFINKRRRAIIDLMISAHINIKENSPDIPAAGRNLYINVSVSHIPRLNGYISSGFSFQTQEFPIFQDGNFSKFIRDKAREGTLSLDDIMNLEEFDGLYLVIFGYDAFSGARKVFESKPYHKDDIVATSFYEKEKNVQAGL
jgi:hypothetical protein